MGENYAKKSGTRYIYVFGSFTSRLDASDKQNGWRLCWDEGCWVMFGRIRQSVRE